MVTIGDNRTSIKAYFQSYVRLAHYELREEIGSGQFGVVKLGVVILI